MCLWLLPECSISVESKSSSSDLDPLSNVSAPSGHTARLDTQLLQSSASLDSSSVLPSPSASFEPIKPDPAGSEYAPLVCLPLQIVPLGGREGSVAPGK